MTVKDFESVSEQMEAHRDAVYAIVASGSMLFTGGDNVIRQWNITVCSGSPFTC